MSDTPSEGAEVTPDEVSAFMAKLEDWGQGLSTTERNILNLVVATAAAGTVEESDVSGFQFANSFDLLRSGLGSNRILFPGAAGKGWVQLGDPWVQGSGQIGQLFSR